LIYGQVALLDEEVSNSFIKVHSLAELRI
jgi:hypothetical protein